jgi:nitroreductase
MPDSSAADSAVRPEAGRAAIQASAEKTPWRASGGTRRAPGSHHGTPASAAASTGGSSGAVELYDAMRTTPATRAYTDEPVDDAVLYRMLDHARFAPSGGNRQGWRVIILKDPAIRKRIRELYQLSWREYAAHLREGLVPFAPRERGRWPGPAVDLDQARQTPAPNEFGDSLEHAPVLLLIVVELGAWACMDNGLDRQSFIGGGSIYPFGHNLLLAARNEGLGGVLTSVLAREEPAVRKLLDIPEGYALAGLLALGHPQKVITKLRRNPVQEFTVTDRFTGPAFTLASHREAPAQ